MAAHSLQVGKNRQGLRENVWGHSFLAGFLASRDEPLSPHF